MRFLFEASHSCQNKRQEIWSKYVPAALVVWSPFLGNCLLGLLAPLQIICHLGTLLAQLWKNVFVASCFTIRIYYAIQFKNMTLNIFTWAKKNSCCNNICYLQSDGGAPTSPLPSPRPRKHSADEANGATASETPRIGLPRNLRLLQRTLSEDVKHRRRDSMPSTPVGNQPPPQFASKYYIRIN